MKRDEALNILETFLTDEELSRLRLVSDMTGACISTFIRMAVADYLKNLPKSLTQRRPLSYAGYWEGNRGRVEHDHHSDHDRDRKHDKHGRHDHDDK
jgi:hypothetical protein